MILCRSGSAETALHHLREITSKLKLTMNEEKLRICRVPDASMRIFLSFQKQLPNRMPPPGVQGGTAHISGTGFTGLLPPTVACGFRGSYLSPDDLRLVELTRFGGQGRRGESLALEWGFSRPNLFTFEENCAIYMSHIPPAASVVGREAASGRLLHIWAGGGPP